MAHVTGVGLALGIALLMSSACGQKDKDPVDAGKSEGGADKDTGDGKWRAAVGDRGVFVQTFDDRVWESRAVAKVDLRSVTCVGNSLAWAVGEQGTILHSSDSGWTWVTQASGTAERLNSVRFAYDDRGVAAGVAAGAAGFLAVTSDAGSTWRSVDVATRVDLNGVAVSEELSAIVVVGNAGTVLRSSDQGRTFSLSTIEGAKDLTAVAITGDGARVLAVDEGGTVWQSPDRGARFEEVFASGGALTGVALSHDGAWALAVSDQGGIFGSAGEGAWTSMKPNAELPLYAVMISHDGERAYVAGEAGALWRTTNGAVTWAKADTGTKEALRGLEDLDPH